MGQVFKTTQPLKLYRVYDTKEAVKMGAYWSLEPPQGTSDQYRRANGVCHRFNEMTKGVVCTIKPGKTLYVGPGQSVGASVCTAPGQPPSQESYDASETSQIVVVTDPNTRLATEIDEGDCEPYPLPWK